MTGRFSERPTRHTGTTTMQGWRLKRYEISLDGETIDPVIMSAVDAVLRANLPGAAGDAQVGFVIVHHGAQQVWILADLWDGDIISQHTFFANFATPTEFAPVAAGGPTACVWELAVHAHEREAFIRHVLDPTDGPDLDAYLKDALVSASHTNQELIDAFNKAWANSNVDALMELMSPDPTYRASTGSGPGTDYHGGDAVRAGFVAVIEAEGANAAPAPPPGAVTVFGNRAMSMWSYPTTTPDGTTVTVEGVDLWTFEADA